jgi:hypothetical protein
MCIGSLGQHVLLLVCCASECRGNIPPQSTAAHAKALQAHKRMKCMDQCCVNSEAHVVREGAGWVVCCSDIRMRSRRGAKHTAQLAPSLTTATTNAHKQATIHAHNNKELRHLHE